MRQAAFHESHVESERLQPHRRTNDERRPRRQPRYAVVLWDDNDHTYHYVAAMMIDLFGMDERKAFAVARKVDTHGRAVCLMTTREHAELKRDQIRAYGRDGLVALCKGSMSATIEPIPET
ncbi:MAG TPA: ATP-dependent Clp protease adaptor ClpS [Pirellulaceae bacterium]